MNTQSHSTDDVVTFRLSQREREEVEVVSRKLGVSRSELFRRSVRLALPILKSVQMPGVLDEEKER